MNRFSVHSLLQRSAAVRLAARGIVFALVAGALVPLAREIQTHMVPTGSVAGTALFIGLVVIEAALFVVIKTVFKKVS